MPPKKTVHRAKPTADAGVDSPEQKKTLDALRKSEAKYRKFHESMQDAFVSVDMKGRILEWNSAYQEMLGYTDEELRALTYQDLTPKKWHALEAVVVAEQILPDGYSGVYEKEYRRKDGTVFPIELRTFLIRDSKDQPATMWAIVRDITERKQTEEAIARSHAELERRVVERTAELTRTNAAVRESEERYRQLVHGLPVAVHTCDTRGRIALYNAAAVELWGREPDRRRDRWCGARRAFTADGKHLTKEDCPVALSVSEDEPVRNTELIIERPDGSRSHVLVFPDPTHDRTGAVTGAVVIQVDITALRVAKNALRTSERKLRTLSQALEQSPASVIITSTAGEIDYVNPKFTEVTGYTPAEVLGKNPRLLKSGGQTTEVYREMWTTILSGKDWRGELCNRKKSGELFWAFAVVAPILDEHGTTTHFVELMEDITERRRAAEELRDREERLRTILNTVEEGILTLGQQGTIVGANPAITRMFGYTAAELIGQNVRLLIPEPGHEKLSPILAKPRRTGEAQAIGGRHEVHGRRNDGTEFPIELAVSELEHLHLFTAVIRDITERKRLEAEVLRIAEEERRRVAADLHDGICQELVGIQYLSIMLREDLKGARHPLAAQVSRIEKALTQVTEHSRQVARGLSPVVEDGSGLMHALRHLTESTARVRRIRCVFQCPEPVLIENQTAANELYRITHEAILNALRHGQAKRISVRLSTANDEIRLAIRDNGRGLPTGVSHAPGMGLRVMQYRAGLIGGQLRIMPRPNGGTEVVCRVPQARLNP